MRLIRFKQFGLAAAFWALAAHGFAASPIWVTTTNDNEGPGSLRTAITLANSFGGGEIRFCVSNTITLLAPLPSLTNITITGPGTNRLTISGNNQFRVLAIDAGSTVSVLNLTIADGTVTNANGAGIFNAGSLHLGQCSVLDCTIAYGGAGGGIYNAGLMVMQECLVADCGFPEWRRYSGTDSAGGGIANYADLRMEGCTVARCALGWGGGIVNGENLMLTNCLIESCSTGIQCDGGGIQTSGNLTAYACILSNCASHYSGGGINMGGGSVALTNCTLANNIAAESGGGFGTEYYGPDTLSVTIYGSTIADNYSDYGGGIQYRGTNLTLINCTVSGNETSLFRSAGGGGINGGAHLTACTVARNMASTGGGVCGDIQSQNSLFASNAGNDISGVLDSMGHNLIQDPSGCDLEGDLTGNLLGVDPRLGPLQNNGGPTWTHALLAGSPAIDAGSGAGAPAVDQRGMHRPQGLAPDIGAFEFQYATPALTRMGVRSCTNFCLSGCGLRGGSYTLQASTNLAQWFNVATNIADTNGVCEFTDSTGSRPSPCFYRALMPVPPGAVYVPAPSGILDAPLVISGTHVSQAVYTGLSGGGRAEYPFIIAKAGNYVLQAMVNAANDGVNSFFLNIDAEPQDPAMIWDIYPYTPGSGFYPRTVSWRGGGSDVANQFIPKVFPLTAGTHRLVIRGREAATFLQSIAITPYP